jgi:phage shock protein C
VTDAPTPPPEEPTRAELPPPEPAVRPVLRRSRDDRVVAGVAGGLARYFGIDPVLLRIAFVVLVFAGGSGILLYLIGWLVIPEERPGEAVGAAVARERSEWAQGPELVGLALIALGVFFLLRLVLPFDWRYVWPVVLILIGAVVLLRGVRR